MGIFGLGQGGGVGGEADQSTGLLAQHRDGRLVEGFHAVFHGFQVGLQHRDGRGDFVGKVTEQLAAGGFHSLKPFGHLVERRSQLVELVAESR